MKKLVYLFGGIFLASLMMVSCSSDSEMMSQFSKRKYLKKFKAKNVKHEDNIEEIENNLAYEVAEPKLTASNAEEVIVEESNEVVTSVKLEQNLNEHAIEQLKRVNAVTTDYSNWNKYNRDFSFNSNRSEVIHHANAMVSSSQASDVVLIILCILLPPVAVILYEDTVTGNFWLDLVLTLLFWLPGMIYAFLVCFADVSI